MFEKDLGDRRLKLLNPDVVVIKELSGFDTCTERHFANLFVHASPRLTTVLNADDRASVALAANAEIRKGRTFYFSKNKALEKQIQKIGGVVSNGDEVRLYGFNAKPGRLQLRLPKIYGIAEETALMASLVAVLDLGLTKDVIAQYGATATPD